MAIGEVYRLTRKVLIDGVEVVNVLHFQDIDGNVADPELTLAEHWDEDGQPCMENDLAFLQDGFTSWTDLSISVQRIAPTQGELYERALHGRNRTPADSGTTTFTQVATNYTTALNSRSGRGRNYWAGIPESFTTGNAFNAAGQTVMDTVLDRFVSDFTEAGVNFIGFVLGVWSEKLLDFNVATAITNSAQLGSMVSRRVGRGN